MDKRAYALGIQQACAQLGIKVAAAPSIPGTTTTSVSKAPAAPASPAPPSPTGQNGFMSRDPASIQAGAAPGGAPQLRAAPVATPATRPGPSPSLGAPAPNPPVGPPSASGITGPIESKGMPAAGTSTSIGINGGNNPFR